MECSTINIFIYIPIFIHAQLICKFKYSRNGEEYEEGANWVGTGDENCTNPKLLWESIVAKLEDLISFVEFDYYDGTKMILDGTEDKFNMVNAKKFSSVDSEWGRCYRIMPTLQMIRKGIRKIELQFLSLCKLNVHTPGIFKTGRSKTHMKNELRMKLVYEFAPEFYEMLDDDGKPCNKDSMYEKDDCFQDAFDKMAIEKYGCTTPFGPNKKMICTNKAIATKVMAMREDWFKNDRDQSNCSTPCQIIMTKPLKTRQETTEQESEMKLYFPDRVKVVRSYKIYSGLALIAEIGGYVGLFLGVSINQITVIISAFEEWIRKH